MVVSPLTYCCAAGDCRLHPQSLAVAEGSLPAKVGAILKALKVADEQRQVKPGQAARAPNLCPVAAQTPLEAKLATGCGPAGALPPFRECRC